MVKDAGFTHLHCHTEYSLLDGAIRLKDLCQKSVDFGFSAAAITDHGNLFGALNFYQTAKSFGIKPIIGCEVYVAPGKRETKDSDPKTRSGYHLVLLCQNQEGYHNLLRLVSKGFLEGFHYKPRVDKELLSKYNSGLIALSACLKGEVPYKLLHSGFDAGLAALNEYTQFFPGRFYLELQANGIPEQDELNAKLIELADSTKLPLVATNDCHYLNPDDVEAHDLLLCIQTSARVNDGKRMRFDTRELYLKSPEEMEAAFSYCPQAIENVGRIAADCNLELDLGQHFFPVYEVEEGKSLEDEFIQLCKQGLEERLKVLPYEVKPEVYIKRLDYELDIICQMGFPAYFLIVQDFINWAKAHGIPVGPGRGSAAGSLVAYSLRITDLDPLRYNLLFERFLNVERISMPDIDVDFCYNRREEVIRYVCQKYGEKNVAQIITFGTMKAKAVVRDVGRALDMSLAYVDKIAKLIPDDLKMTIAKALQQEPDLAKLVKDDPEVSKLIDISRRLEGLSRHASTHAAGIVISDKPMEEYLPLYKGKKGEVVTQFDMKKVEQVGLIKFDFLGLKTLTVISDALKLIEQSGKHPPNLETLSLDDEETFKLLCRAETEGVFQLESSGMRKVLHSLRPSCFEDIIALLALYRPGPLESGMVDDFISRKHGETDITYEYECLAPLLQPILEDTYGVILYQEQVMRIAGSLASYSLGEGDMLRRAMGKKDPAVMAQQRSRFMQGARENGLPEEAAAYIFDLMEKFAGYGFNKSHSAAYALVSYQTAYLKAHYQVEFMAALITSEVGVTDKVIAHINACREQEIKILPPDINHSFCHFTVENGKMRFGLSGIKGVGEGAIASIVEARQEGEYTSLLDFCQRVNLRKANKKVLEQLIKCGAMDCLGCSRAALLSGMDKIMAMAQRNSKRKTGGQLSFFNMVADEDSCSLSGLGADLENIDMGEMADDERLRQEKEALGFFLSGHPLLPFSREIARMRLDTIENCRESAAGREMKLSVLVTGIKEYMGKKGKMAFCQIEDLTGTGEMTAFPEIYAKYKELLQGDEPLLAKARISSYGGDKQEGEVKQVKLLLDEVGVLAKAVQAGSDPVCVDLGCIQPQAEHWQSLKLLLAKYPGPAPVQLKVQIESMMCKMQLGPGFSIGVNPQFWNDVKSWQAGCSTTS